jgi:hypothetical protein
MMMATKPTKISTVIVPSRSCSVFRLGVGVGGSSAITTVIVGEGVGDGSSVGVTCAVGEGDGVTVDVAVSVALGDG